MRRIVILSLAAILLLACESAAPEATGADVAGADVSRADVAEATCEDVVCGEWEVCIAGQCAPDESGMMCNDITCGPCETCDPMSGECVADCADDCVCEEDECVCGADCVPNCAGRDCGGDSCGGSCGECARYYFCNADQQCEGPYGAPMCQQPGAAYCDAVVVNEIALAPPADAAAGEPGCCCDYDGDGVNDNAVGALFEDLLGRLTGLYRADVNALLAAQLADGELLLLFELLFLTAMDAEEWLTVAVYLGEDTDDDPTNNWLGDAEFTVDPVSLTEDGEALVRFEGASLDDEGVLRAPGPDGMYGEFILPVQLPAYGLDLLLTLEGVRLEAQMSQTDGRYAMADGHLCGYLRETEVFAVANAFAAANCPCLGLTGDLMVDDGEGNLVCADTSSSTCDSTAGGLEEVCAYFDQMCSLALTVLPAYLDVDIDDNGVGDALSVGLNFSAVSAILLERVL